MANANKKVPLDLRSLARSYTVQAVQTLGGIMMTGESETARVTAAVHLLDRGWGKAEQVHSGDISQDIRITIRQILDGPAAKVIEHDKQG